MTTLQTIMAWPMEFYARHEGVCNLFAFSAIANMPRSNGKSVLYGWTYGTLQSFMGALRPHPPEAAPSAPTFPPIEPMATTDGK